ncbi:MAG TPA: glycosyltransferase family 39 protein [Longimicrobium sp.]|nr:glycosyltransferase family 39 protein [Longimicrobium sp.]
MLTTRRSAPHRVHPAPPSVPSPAPVVSGTGDAASWGAAVRALPAWVVPAVVWLLSAALILVYLRRGWVGHDEGTLVHAVQRVLDGEVPHRDFIDMYSGGLTYLHAAAFRLFGATMLSPRIVLLIAALAWVPAVYAIARRFQGPLAAGGVTLAAVAWSVPNYTAAMPSWFNTFLATWGLAALLRYADTRRARWLLVAGACAGVSVTIKIVGLYFLAAGVLALLFLEQEDRDGNATAGGSPAWGTFLVAGLGIFALALVMLVRPRMGPPEAFHFVLPGAAVAAAVAWNERMAPSLPFVRRLRRALALLGPFVLGFAVPVGVFAAWFAAQGALGALVHGVLVLPFERLSEAAMRPVLLKPTLKAALPLVVLLLVPVRERIRPLVGALPWIGAAVMLAVIPEYSATYRLTFNAARAIIPLSVVAGCAWLALRTRQQLPAGRRFAALAVFSTAAVCSLVQYPFSAPVYFSYVVPLGVLAAAAALSLNPAPSRGGATLVLVYATLFALLWVNRGYVYGMGLRYWPSGQVAVLPGAMSGGIRVAPDQAVAWGRAAELMRAHAGGSAYAWAGPDTPELYPLSGLKNPTPHLFEHFADPATFEPDLLRVLEQRGVNVVVINTVPLFSPELSPATLAELARRYPRSERVQAMVGWRRRTMEVRWRP